MPTPILRPATSADMAAVAELWHRGWHDGHAGHVPAGLTAARTREAFGERAVLRVPDTTLAEVAAPGTPSGSELAGFVMVAGDEIEQVYVDRGHRGSGVAAVLLTEAERQVAAQGYAEAWLAVVIGNTRARAFYAREGWRDEGDLPYEVTAGGSTYISPCRRYTRPVSA